MTNTYLLSTQTANKTMKSIIGLLKKTQKWILEQKIDENSLLEARLAPDMFPLKKQIQIITDNAKGFSARFAGIEIPKYEDNEITIDDLIDRLNRTIEFVGAIPSENFDNASEEKIVLPFIQGKFQSAEDYLRDYALPNFFFHVVIAYAIIRNQGLPIGKSDFINDLNLQDL